MEFGLIPCLIIVTHLMLMNIYVVDSLPSQLYL